MTFIIYKYKRFVSLYLVRFTSSILQFVIDSGERNVNESQLIICLLLYERRKMYIKNWIQSFVNKEGM